MKIRAFLAIVVLSAAVLACQQPAEDTEEAAVPPKSGPDSALLDVEAVEVEQAPHYEKQILTMAELMKLLVDPIYEDLKEAIEVPPKRRKAWRMLYIASYNLAEVNNLLFSREDEDEKKQYLYTQKWIDETIEAADLLLKLADSVRAQAEYDVLKANYMAVMNNCNQCHREFELEVGEIDVIGPPTSWDAEVEEEPEVIQFL